MGKLKIGIDQILSETKGIFLDSMFFIYHFEENVRFSAFTTQVLDWVEQGKARASTSYLTLMEILVKPMKQGRGDLVEAYKIALETFPNLRFITLESSVAFQAATFRVSYNLKPADSIQLASALVSDCDIFLTNDRGLTKVTELRVACMDDLIWSE